MSQDTLDRLAGHRVPNKYFYPYSVAERIQQLLRYRVFHPNPFRPIGALILGDPANGKSFLLRDFRKQINEKFSDGDNPEILPTVFFDAPSGATRNLLFYSLAEAMGVPLPARGIADRFIPVLLQTLHRRQVRVIIVDELNNLVSGPSDNQRKILDDLKTFSNKLGIPVIVSGTRRAYEIIRTDRQYLSRWPPLFLPQWGPKTDIEPLILSLETEMEVLPGTYANSEAIELILKLSTGLIGRIVEILNDSFQDAFDSGAKKVTCDHILKAGFTDLPWVLPIPQNAI